MFGDGRAALCRVARGHRFIKPFPGGSRNRVLYVIWTRGDTYKPEEAA